MISPPPFKPKNNNKIGRNDAIFDNELEEIIRERYAKGLDKKPVGRATVQRKIVKMPIWNQMKMNLKSWEFLPDAKKGQAGFESLGLSNPTINLFTIIIVSFLAVLFFAGLAYTMNLVYAQLLTVPDLAISSATNGSISYVNMTTAATSTFGKAVGAMDGLRLVSMAMIFAMILGTLAVNFFIRAHPILWIVYIFITGLAVMFSVPVSNAYESMISNSAFPLSYYLQQHSMASYMLLHLPVVITIVGALGGILMFVNIMRAGNEAPL